MKKYIFSILLLAGSMAAMAQSTDSQNIKIETTQEAHFPGGEEKLYHTVYNNLRFSEEAKKNKVNTQVTVSFFVMPDSTISNIRILTDPGFGCADSLKTMLKQVKFAPALMNGTPFRTQLMLNLPVRAH